RIEQIAKEICTQQNVALYDVELKRAAKGLIIVIYITKVSGVTIDVCKIVSNKISNILEEEDFIDERYFLEVSSPGLERDLKLKKHYVSAIGEKVKITFSYNEKSKTEIGTLLEVLPDSIKMEFDGQNCEIRFSQIKKARTYFDYKK
ncbi:MAG: ribosome maturation factor RimP, partial [Candidatus Cloacimonetes bacterium]|nr:ribosome maturation factor RimP [Candidatus Cloacimonadota bacterium]